MGTHMRVHSESYPINTNMIGFRQFSKNFASLIIILIIITLSFDIAPFPYKHAQRRILVLEIGEK